MRPLDIVHLSALMQRTHGRREVRIGMIDGPVFMAHPDLASENIKEIPNKLPRNLFDPQYCGPCPVDEDLAEVDVAALADAEQLRLAAGRILSWHETEPSSKVTALSKGRAVADGGNDSRGHDRPDARNLPDAGTAWVGRGDPFQLEAKSL